MGQFTIRRGAAGAALFVVALLAGQTFFTTETNARRDQPAAPQAFNSGSNSELVTLLPVTKSGTPDIHRVVYCVDIGTVPAPGSIIYATAELEVTSDIASYPPLVSGHIVLVESCEAAVATPGTVTGTDITEANGENCSYAVQHHCTFVKSGVLVVGNTSRHFVALVMHAASGYAAWRLGDVVKVEPDYGRLGVIVWFWSGG